MKNSCYWKQSFRKLKLEKEKKKEKEKRTRVIYSSVKVNLTLCLVGWNLGGMENIGEKMWIFCCLGREENEREWKIGRKLSLRTHKFLSPQFGRISLLASPPTLITFAPTHLTFILYFVFIF